MEYLPYFLAVVAVCGIIVTKAILGYLNKTKALNTFNGYQGIALKVFEKIEKEIPDNFGTGTDDGKIQKSVHKLDLFLKEFGALYKKTSGKNMSAALMDEARIWVQIWADQKTVEKAQEAPNEEPTNG
jgi:hypothetical protein